MDNEDLNKLYGSITTANTSSALTSALRSNLTTDLNNANFIQSYDEYKSSTIKIVDEKITLYKLILAVANINKVISVAWGFRSIIRGSSNNYSTYIPDTSGSFSSSLLSTAADSPVYSQVYSSANSANISNMKGI